MAQCRAPWRWLRAQDSKLGHSIADWQWHMRYPITRLLRWHVCALLAIIVIGISLRLWRVETKALSSDEAFSWRMAAYPTPEMLGRLADDVHPPGYYLALQGWMQLFGASRQSLRGLSVSCGLLCIPLVYWLIREVTDDRAVAPWALHGGALFGAFLVAVHWGQVLPSRTARMYSLGALMATVTTLLLAKAIKRGERRGWWVAYGIAAALFAYVHNLAFFSLAAQGTFVAAASFAQRYRQHLPTMQPWLRRLANESTSAQEIPKPERGTCEVSLTGAGLAIGIMLAAYTPWMPRLIGQVQRVSADYWIPRQNPRETVDLLFRWATGLDGTGGSVVWPWFFVLLTMVGIALARRPGEIWFLFTQTAIPWVLAIVTSLATGQSVLLLRTMTFANIALIALLGVMFCRSSGLAERAILVVIIVPPSLVATGHHLGETREGKSGITLVADFLTAHTEPGDVALVAYSWELNRLRYECILSGGNCPDIRWKGDPTQKEGQVSHVASLTFEDTAYSEGNVPAGVRHVWAVGDALVFGSIDVPGTGWSQAYLREFRGGEGAGDRYYVAKYSRVSSAKAKLW